MSEETTLSYDYSQLRDLLESTFKILHQKAVGGELAKSLKSSNQTLSNLVNKNEEQLYDAAPHTRLILNNLANKLKKESNSELSEIGKRISEITKKIDEKVKSRTVVFTAENIERPLTLLSTKERNENSNLSETKRLIDEIEQRQLNKEAELNQRIANLTATLESLEKDVKSKLQAVEKLYDDTDLDLKDKLNSVNNQISTIAAGTMARDFGRFALIEKRIADQYRKFSLWAMFGLAVFVSFSLWQVASHELTISESLIRLSFILIVSAPAAYLTRESSKHREQENAHRQTQLDLRAITPYIASLSPTEQSQIKTQIALRLFGARNGQANSNEGIPINTNDLLMKLLDKVDLTGSAKKGNSPD